jgi:hypothetical protein
MTSKKILGALALAATMTSGLAAPVSAQPYAAQSGAMDYWRGAPDGLQQRIDWLQQRITRGTRDGSLTRAEARRAQYQLDMLRRDAGALQARLDSLTRSIRWARNDGGYGNGGYGAGGYGGAGGYRQPYTTDYDAYRYYRDDTRYTERRLAPDEEIYRGSDGRYYCKRSDGTTGLVIGAIGGAALGNVIDGGRDRVAGTLIGGALGAFLGKTVDQNQSQNDVRCR